MAITIRKISCPDVDVSNSDNSYTTSVASGESLSLPDENITLNGGAFITKPSVKNQDILLKDVSGNMITPEALSGNTITIKDEVINTGWQRPAEWIDMPNVANGDKVFYGLYLVFENQHNQVDIKINSAGSAYIDFENNGVEILNSGGVDSYVYDYASLGGAVNVYTEDGSNRNYKQVFVKIRPNGSNPLWCQFLNLNADSGINDGGTSGFVDIVCDFSGGSSRLVLGFHKYLRIFKCTNTGTSNRFFGGNWNVPELRIIEMPAGTFYGYQGMANIKIFQEINDDISGSWDSSYVEGVNGNGNNITGLNASLKYINDISNSGGGSDSFWNFDCEISGSVSMPNATNMRRCFQNCTTTKLVFTSIYSTPSATFASGGTFTGMYNLKELILPSFRVGFSIANSNMDADALDAMFTSLGTANGAQTITITGNPGAATCDTTIATGKGFTIVV